jgi:phosphoribosylaminoimidazole-succinocarboxamide synthase
MERKMPAAQETKGAAAFMGLEEIGIQPGQRGKVREIIDLDTCLLLVATDRISAFDHVMPNGIPGRGSVLGRIAAFWLRGYGSMMPTHFLSDDPHEFPERFREYSSVLAGRAMLVRKAEPIKVECIVRGYLAGSGCASYLETGEISGVKLPEGLKQFDLLPEPVFTPTTKADEGHDEPMTLVQLADQFGTQLAKDLQRLSLEVYAKGATYAKQRGIVIADTKLEFGWIDGKIALIDEVLTPDSSRFWPAQSVGRGKQPVSLDKQFLRDYLLSVNWDRESPPPALPEEIISKTRERYLMAEDMLTGGAEQPKW